MRIHYFPILLLMLFQGILASAHSGKARYHVIIETDGGLDDMRAISLLLASSEAEVIGIYCTEGILSPGQTATNVRDLLSVYHHEGIPLGFADEFLTAAPPQRDLLQQIHWGPARQSGEPERTPDFLQNIYTAEDENITYICLGSLRAIITEICPHEWMLKKTEQIIWYNEDNEDHGFNYKLFKENCQYISEAGLNFVQVSPSTENMPYLDNAFWLNAQRMDSRYSALLSEIHNSSIVREKLHTGREHIWDELAAIYLLKPELFSSDMSRSIPGVVVHIPTDPEKLIPVYLDMLKEKRPDYKIFSHLPIDPSYYQEDIAPYIDDILKRYGEAEWRAGVICFELHGHIGIYAIIGVKMGLRAREYFNIGLDDLYIESLAGLTPPFSCLNDGLQVSTGSSLGHGLIRASGTDEPSVTAVFRFKEQEIRISLKPEISKRMKNDIEQCINEHGNLTHAYWQAVRELALQYWVDLDRNEIFNLTKKN